MEKNIVIFIYQVQDNFLDIVQAIFNQDREIIAGAQILANASMR